MEKLPSAGGGSEGAAPTPEGVLGGPTGQHLPGTPHPRSPWHTWGPSLSLPAARWGDTARGAGVVPFVALLLLQRRPVAGRALLVTGSGCPGHGLCRSNVLEQTRRQVAVLNATAQELFSLYLKCQGEPFSSESDKLCNPAGIFFPAFRVNRTSERKEVMVAMYKLFAFLNTSLGNITRDQEELNPMAKELLERLHNTTKTTRGLISNLTCLLCKNYNIFQVDVRYGDSSKGKSAFKKKQQGCQVLRKYVQVIGQAARVLLPHLSPS
ncbi:LOW QUALITY PROTEIN: leukemia inhibitory factor [Sylvia atricapilla]|uniref:LOW QUALITY PROTEIN: leukemia inhibitory factor n=1 Tax=Sylvia atricapilla TaxID=48155 RepID=UPI0033990A5A